MMAQAREEKRLAEEKGTKKGEVVINTWDHNEELARPGATVEEYNSDEEDEAPPELEKITTEEFQNEWSAMSEEQKN